MSRGGGLSHNLRRERSQAWILPFHGVIERRSLADAMGRVSLSVTRADVASEWPAWTMPLRARLRRDVSLAPFTTLKIGGPADWYYAAQSVAELALALTTARTSDIPITLLGDGSNVLISDLGVRGLVIHNRACAIERRGDNLFSEAGALLSALVDRSRAEALTGMEFASGIYGSVGGAVFGNAGAYGKSIADVLSTVEVLTRDGQRLQIPPERMEFSYRQSGCAKNGWTVLACEVALAKGDQDAIGAEIDRIIALRATKLPSELPSAGSYFKNIEDPTAEFGKVPAGKLLEAVGAKELRVGDAGVYLKHANVIVNLGHATAADVLALADQMKAKVKAAYGIELQPEVRFVGEPHKRATEVPGASAR
jgi:UDP-N-acetylmuramate dehydrogenase